jgi:hypothetical protein
VTSGHSEVSARIRFDVPNAARVWNYWLGGSEHYPLDRQAGDEFMRSYPRVCELATESRAFQARALRYLAREQGIRQFVDVGIGMPTSLHTHDVAQSVAPDSRIVYVDNDPLVLVHARAWMAHSTAEGRVEHLDADVREPSTLLSETMAILDRELPAALLLMGTVGLAVTKAGQLRDIISELMAGFAPGSFLVLGEGVGASDSEPDPFSAACARFGYHTSSDEELRSALTGLELIEPGLVPVEQWRPEEPDSTTNSSEREPLRLRVAVAHKT